MVALGLAVAIFGSAALTRLGDCLTVQGQLQESDAIVVLSGDDGGRLEQGVWLYREGYAPILVLSGAGEQGRPSAAEVMKRQAIALGVPAAAILLVEQSTSTWEDAGYTRALMTDLGLKSAIVVTSPYHGLRASLAFARAFDGSGIRVTSYPVQDDRWRPDSWWTSIDTVRLTLNELIKLAYYELSGYL